MTNCDSWDAAARARVSDRWTTHSADWNTSLTEALLAEATLSPGLVVLDLAAGSGDPALSIAERLSDGRVIAIDSSQASLLLANSHAQQLGLGSRIECLQADAQAIPIAPNCVDRVTCRFGIMFFRDIARAMSEIMRVLKPGGRVAFLAWGSFDQPFFEATVGVVLRMVRGAEVPAEARQMFRFAAPGSLNRELRAAGFSEVHEQPLTLPRIWAGTPEELWLYQQEVSTLCQPLFASVPPALSEELDSKVSSALARFEKGGVLRVPVNVIIVAGTKAQPSRTSRRARE